MKFLTIILLALNVAVCGRAQNVTQTVSTAAAGTVVGIPLVVEENVHQLAPLKRNVTVEEGKINHY